MAAAADPTGAFLVQADRTCREARFIIDSLPNVEPFAAERSLRQLQAVLQVLSNLQDPWISGEELEPLISKDALEFFRQLFAYLEENRLLDMGNVIERICLFLVFQPRIQAALDAARQAWNLHKIRTARNKTPTAIYELSRVKAIRLGYWTGDPGDDLATAGQEGYGQDAGAHPPADELAVDPQAVDYTEFADADAEAAAGVFVNNADEIDEMRRALGEFDFAAEDGNNGLDVYCRAVLLATAYFSNL
ncbi:hypothetical protein C8F01DRAFT_989671 [Mycena amicta]|nr:hypothetical protein C8F01DRAFT_989671 [Mycena amicta]